MDWSANHAGFVAAAYAVSGIVLAALLLVIWRQKHRLDANLKDANKNHHEDR